MKKIFLFLSLVLLSGCAGFNNIQKINFFNTLEEEASKYTASLPSNHIPLTVTERVCDYIQIYNTGARENLRKILSRAHKYFPMMKQAFLEAGLPEELIYLPIIESGFMTCAYSPAHASGPWQFVQGTGRIYGLKSDWWVDERRSPEKSTIAAVSHLKDLYNWLKDWHLALASYNAGGGTIMKAMNKYKTKNFWEMIQGKRSIIKKETKNYVPQFIAVTIICENLGKFDFTDIEKEQPLLFDIAEIPDATDLKLIAELCGTTYENIKELNPELKQWATPPKYEKYRLRIPYNKKEEFLTRFTNILPEDRITYRRHQIKKGESLWGISAKYKIPLDMIMEMNKLSKTAFIREGNYLIIPIRGLENAKEIDKRISSDNSK